MSLRKIGVLVGQLPPESTTATAIRNATPPEEAAAARRQADPAESPWSTSDMLMAAVVDELRFLRHTLVQVNSERPIGHPPEPMARPGIVSKKRKLDMRQRMALDPRLAKYKDRADG